MGEIRKITLKEVETLRRLLIKNKDKPSLKRLRNGLIKSNEYRWLIKENNKGREQ